MFQISNGSGRGAGEPSICDCLGFGLRVDVGLGVLWCGVAYSSNSLMYGTTQDTGGSGVGDTCSQT